MNFRLIYIVCVWFTSFAVCCESILPPSLALAQVSNQLPVPGTRVSFSPAYEAPRLVGIKIDVKDPLHFNFLIDKGNAPGNQAEYEKLVKYFLTSLTTPEKEMWVNLSPYEGNKLIPDTFGKTELGRDLLAQDYILKQLTASAIYPETEPGKSFWAKVYAEARKKRGTTDIPINTFNKVWIVPDKVTMFEKGNVAVIVDSHLKVMLESDYLALQKANVSKITTREDAPQMGTDIVRQVIIPQLEREVNEGKHFSLLRQAYSAMILATWFKMRLKRHALSHVYINKNKDAGIEQPDIKENERIFQRYVQSYKKGSFNYIKEEYVPLTGQMMPRKYFSGGIHIVDEAMISTSSKAKLLHNFLTGGIRILVGVSAILVILSAPLILKHSLENPEKFDLDLKKINGNPMNTNISPAKLEVATMIVNLENQYLYETLTDPKVLQQLEEQIKRTGKDDPKVILNNISFDFLDGMPPSENAQIVFDLVRKMKGQIQSGGSLGDHYWRNLIRYCKKSTLMPNDNDYIFHAAVNIVAEDLPDNDGRLAKIKDLISHSKSPGGTLREISHEIPAHFDRKFFKYSAESPIIIQGLRIFPNPKDDPSNKVSLPNILFPSGELDSGTTSSDSGTNQPEHESNKRAPGTGTDSNFRQIELNRRKQRQGEQPPSPQSRIDNKGINQVANEIYKPPTGGIDFNSRYLEFNISSGMAQERWNLPDVILKGDFSGFQSNVSIIGEGSSFGDMFFKGVLE